MKLSINLLFGSEFASDLIKSDSEAAVIQVTLTEDIFDNVQNIKEVVKKYILSGIFKITAIDLDGSIVKSNSEIQTLNIFDTILSITLNKQEGMDNVAYQIIGNNLPENKEHSILKLLIHKYMDLLYSCSNKINPESLSQYMLNICKELITDKQFLFKEIIATEDTFPLLHAVGKGGAKAPRLLVCGFGVDNDHDLNNTDYKVCLIGKGVTFDSGGYCIKTATGMMEMSYDKSGSVMAFFASIFNYLANGIKTIYISPVVQNFINEEAYLPGEIIVSKLGVKVHIENTDAEGRLILADAMEYAISNFKFQYCLEFATLTGAASVAVGNGRNVFLTSCNKLSNCIEEVSNQTGEKAHRLPNDKYYKKLLMKTIRHQKLLNNVVTTREAGTITGGVFIEHFYTNAHQVLEKKTVPPFCHFDIAPLINLNYFDTMSYSYNLWFISQLCKKI